MSNLPHFPEQHLIQVQHKKSGTHRIGLTPVRGVGLPSNTNDFAEPEEEVVQLTPAEHRLLLLNALVAERAATKAREEETTRQNREAHRLADILAKQEAERVGMVQLTPVEHRALALADQVMRRRALILRNRLNERARLDRAAKDAHTFLSDLPVERQTSREALPFHPIGGTK
jgi:hypothetical protein